MRPLSSKRLIPSGSRHVIAVIFELEPHPDAQSRYFELAAALGDELRSVDGFVSVERFQSVTRPGRFVSLSFWRDEEAVRAWRCNGRHRDAQQAGRGSIFASYRLRVAAVVRDYGLDDREQAPADSLASLA